MAVAFDTLAFHDRLRAGGFTEQQAKAATEAFAQATSQELATKADLDRLEAALKADIENVRTELRAEIESLRTELRAEIENLRTELRAEIENLRTELRAEIESLRTELRGEMQALEQRLLMRLTESQNAFIKWLVPLMIGQTALLAALIKLL